MLNESVRSAPPPCLPWRLRGVASARAGLLIGLLGLGCRHPEQDEGRGPRSAASDPSDPDPEADSGATIDTAGAGAAGGTVTFTAMAATTTELAYPLTTLSGSTQYLITEAVSVGAEDRIYLYADYYMGGYTLAGQFTVFGIMLDAGGCWLSLTNELPDEALLTGEVVDATGDAPVTVPLSPLGGAGVGPDDLGVNVWDVTDVPLMDPDCGPTPRESLDYSARTSYAIFWQYGGYGAVVRSFRLYVGRALP